MPKLSIIVGTLDRPGSLETLINSINTNTTIVDWELIISDAGIKFPLDVDDFRNYKLREGGDIRLLLERPRLGHVAGYNRAFRSAKGEYVCWLNDDAVVVKGWDKCVEVMEKNPWIGMGALKFGTFSDNYLSFDYQGLPYANFGIIKRTLGEELGWFDEDILYFYGGDNSLAFKVYLKNMPVVPLPGGHVIHRPFMDDYRTENEARQAGDAYHLMERYRPMLVEMHKNNDRYKEWKLK